MSAPKTIAAFILFILLSTAWLVPGCHRKPAAVRLVDYLLAQQLTTATDSAGIQQVLDTLVKGTLWESNVQINKPWLGDRVNIFIIDGSYSYVREDDNLGPYVDNCSYISSNIIILDIAFLRGFLDKHGFVWSQFDEVAKEEYHSFLLWNLGHELGHLVGQHSKAHFDGGSLDSFVQNATLDNKQEMEADSFFVQSIINNSRLRSSVEQLMIGILNAEIKQKVGIVPAYGVGIIYDYANQAVIEYARHETHPDYVIRLARMLLLSAKMSGDAGLYNLIEGFIRQLKESSH
jgi:hypothetical protein